MQSLKRKIALMALMVCVIGPTIIAGTAASDGSDWWKSGDGTIIRRDLQIWLGSYFNFIGYFQIADKYVSTDSDWSFSGNTWKCLSTNYVSNFIFKIYQSEDWLSLTHTSIQIRDPDTNEWIPLLTHGPIATDPTSNSISLTRTNLARRYGTRKPGYWYTVELKFWGDLEFADEYYTFSDTFNLEFYYRSSKPYIYLPK